MQTPYYNGPDDFNVDAHATQVVTAGVVQNPGVFQSNLEAIRHARYDVRFATTLAAADYTSADVAKANVRKTIHEVINYVCIQPSARDNAVCVAINGLRWELLGGTYYPVGDFWARSGQGSQVFRIPTARNYLIEAVTYPVAGYTAPYADFLTIGVGYLPDGLEKVAIDNGR